VDDLGDALLVIGVVGGALLAIVGPVALFLHEQRKERQPYEEND
jgi:hypothetical protein